METQRHIINYELLTNDCIIIYVLICIIFVNLSMDHVLVIVRVRPPFVYDMWEDAYHTSLAS